MERQGPAKQSLRINCVPSNYTTFPKLPMAFGLKTNPKGIGSHRGFLPWSRFYRLLWHNSALSLGLWLQNMMVWGTHHKKRVDLCDPIFDHAFPGMLGTKASREGQTKQPVLFILILKLCFSVSTHTQKSSTHLSCRAWIIVYAYSFCFNSSM